MVPRPRVRRLRCYAHTPALSDAYSILPFASKTFTACILRLTQRHFLHRSGVRRNGFALRNFTLLIVFHGRRCWQLRYEIHVDGTTLALQMHLVAPGHVRATPQPFVGIRHL